MATLVCSHCGSDKESRDDPCSECGLMTISPKDKRMISIYVAVLLLSFLLIPLITTVIYYYYSAYY